MSSHNNSNGIVVGGIVLCCVLGAIGYYAYQSSGNGPVVGAQTEALVTPERVEAETQTIAPVASPESETPEAAEVAAVTTLESESPAKPEVVPPTEVNPQAEDQPDQNPEPAVEAELQAEQTATPSPAPTPMPASTAAPLPETEAKLEPESAPEAELAPEAKPAPEPETEPELEAEPAPEPEPAPEAKTADLPPIFDLIRIDRSGAGLVAGRATPDSDIEIVNDGQVVGRARTGRDGAFVAYIAVDPSVAAQQLIAQAAGDVTTVAPISAPVVVVASPEEDVAPVIFQPSEQGVRLIQPAARASDSSVTLDSISYDTAGRVTFTGRAMQSAAIRLYLDDVLTLETRAADDGSWRATAGAAIAPGVYTLRVDQVDETGAVTSRMETPFLREQIVEGALGDNQLTVQTGNNLWKLAEGIYGAGTRYTLIYQANRDAIRDPDLIYPGQIFKLPDAAWTE